MKNYFDVLIIGSGLAGCTLSIILSKIGLKVLLVDQKSHPRFAIGESTIPYTTQGMSCFSEYYDIPEISTRAIIDAIGHTFGEKEAFSFIYQTKGKVPKPEECFYDPLGHPEIHFYRQELDSYLFTTAIRYGTSVKQNFTIAETQFDADKVTIISDKNEKYCAPLIIDGSGYNSILANKFNLREYPTSLKTKSTSMFTHMIDVKRFNDVLPKSGAYPTTNYHKTTLHHIFKEGWLWVIPFNNHKNSKNPAVSIGLMLDPEKYVLPNGSSDEIFMEFINQYPTIKTQFSEAKRIREWIKTPRIQYSSKSAVGDRYILLPHSYGFVDPLFSRGIPFTIDGIKRIASLTESAFQKNDFSQSHFSSLDILYKKILTHTDDLVHGSYSSFEEFELWRHWYFVWQMASIMGDNPSIISRVRLNRGDSSHYSNFDIKGDTPEFHEFMDVATKIIVQHQAKQITSEKAKECLRNLYEHHNIPLYLTNKDMMERFDTGNHAKISYNDLIKYKEEKFELLPKRNKEYWKDFFTEEGIEYFSFL